MSSIIRVITAASCAACSSKCPRARPRRSDHHANGRQFLEPGAEARPLACGVLDYNVRLRDLSQRLTDQLEAAANDYLAEIDGLGGAVKAIEAGYQQRQIQEAAYHSQRRIEAGEQIVVGVNKFVDGEVHTPELQRIDPAGEREQVARVRRVRETRDAAAFEASLRKLSETARGDGNLVPAIIDAVKARATLGEISDALRAAFGEHRELITV